MAIRSMTGYGQAAADLTEGRVNVELRTVNHRYADLRLKMPSELASMEADLRRRILKRIKRGRVEVSIGLERGEGAEARPVLNRPLMDEVRASCGILRDEFGIKGKPKLGNLLLVPGMFRSRSADLEWGEAEQEAMDRALAAALDALEAERTREGSHLCDEMLQRLGSMVELAAQVKQRASELPDMLRDKLLERLKSLSGAVALDPGRTEQEAAILADRCDVTEEIVRLEGHLDQARKLLGEPDGQPVGKRVDFLLQEINRETNTINSKSADLELSRFALALKADIEKVREQAQNLE